MKQIMQMANTNHTLRRYTAWRKKIVWVW